MLEMKDVGNARRGGVGISKELRSFLLGALCGAMCLAFWLIAFRVI
jgi:hypothetical protein